MKIDMFTINFSKLYQKQSNKLDFLLYAWENQVPLEQVSKVLELSNEAVARAFKDFASKNIATKHLREMAYSID